MGHIMIHIENGLRLQHKFIIALLAVSCLMVGAALYFAYQTAYKEGRTKAFETCFQILASVEASRAYVRNTLRPAVLKVVEKGEFIPEAMSASFVARAQLENFLKEYPDYHVKFASLNPRNPINQANALESEILKRFSGDSNMTEWQGITEIDGVEHYTVAKPFRFKEGCMKCHGDPVSAPKEIVARYGGKNGFWRKIGDVTMYSISSPIRVTYQTIWDHTFALFLPMAGLTLFILGISSFLMNQMVTKPIKLLSERVETLSEEDYTSLVEIKTSGELKALAMAFNAMTEKLNESHLKKEFAEKQLRESYDQLEQRVEERTSELTAINEKLKEQIREREKAESKVKILTGLLPICSHCKKIRDDKGYWNSLEKYLQDHSDATLSHGICQDCLKQHYPGYNV